MSSEDGAFEKQNVMAKEILTDYRGKVLAIEKATRSGATYGLLKNACELGQQTVIVAPYVEILNRILDEVSSSVKGKKPVVAHIKKNEEMCEKIKRDVEDKKTLI